MEVSRSGHIKAAAVSIAVILLISVGCVLGYHYLVSKSIEENISRVRTDVDQTVIELARINGDMVLVFSALDEMQRALILKEFQVEALMRNQDIFLLINKEQTRMIRGLDRRELARHLEVIRALAQRQKEHWALEKRNKSSGFGPSGRELNIDSHMKAYKEIMLPAGKQPSLEESDKTIQKW